MHTSHQFPASTSTLSTSPTSEVHVCTYSLNDQSNSRQAPIDRANQTCFKGSYPTNGFPTLTKASPIIFFKGTWDMVYLHVCNCIYRTHHLLLERNPQTSHPVLLVPGHPRGRNKKQALCYHLGIYRRNTHTRAHTHTHTSTLLLFHQIAGI